MSPLPTPQVVQFVQSFVNRVLADLATFGFYSASGGGEADAAAASAGLLTDKDGAFHSDSSVRNIRDAARGLLSSGLSSPFHPVFGISGRSGKTRCAADMIVLSHTRSHATGSKYGSAAPDGSAALCA